MDLNEEALNDLGLREKALREGALRELFLRIGPAYGVFEAVESVAAQNITVLQGAFQPAFYLR